MTLKEIFDHLTYGELSQLNLGGDLESDIPEERQIQVISSINLGLTDLHKRFRLKEKEVRVQLVEGQRHYWLQDSFAVSSPVAGPKYLLDSIADPFDARGLVKIERIYTEDYREMPLNVGDLEYASELTPYIKTPTANSIWVSPELPLQVLTVVYRAKPEWIERPAGYFDPSQVEVDLPDTHLEALLFFIASRALNPIGMGGGGNNAMHEGNNYAAKYEAVCAQLEMGGYEVRDSSNNYRLYRAGWE